MTADRGCVGCGTAGGGGVHTNFDPYGTRAKLGLSVEPWQFICWQCWISDPLYREKDRRMRDEADRAAASDGRCGFLMAWVGHCLESTPCSRHAAKRCWKCGEQANRECAIAGSLVCGVPECVEHPHAGEHYA